MILSALKEYYEREAADPESDIAMEGYEWKEIPYLINIDRNGNFVMIESTVEQTDKKKRGKRFLVPQGIKRANGVYPNLLWDTPEYALGVKMAGKKEQKLNPHEEFKKRIEGLGKSTDEGLIALRTFLTFEYKLDLLSSDPNYPVLIEENPFIAFKIAGESKVICDSPAVRQLIDSQRLSGEGKKGICLLTGQVTGIERLHASIKGVYGAQSSGASIVSFNASAFESFGKEQGDNSPISKSSSFCYTTALNYLLGKDSQQRMQVGDTSTVFWSKKPSDLETNFVSFFSEPPKDDPARGTNAVKSLYQSAFTGNLRTDLQNEFYVLGLSPNAARIAIRFWHVDTVEGMSAKLAQHFKDLEIEHAPFEKDVLPLYRLLCCTALQGKSENVAPNLAGETMRSILTGAPYPYILLNAVIRRMRAEQADENQNVSYPRVSLIKAILNRLTRTKNPTLKEELKVSLDSTNTNIGYRLGRLFCTLERLQSTANPGLNATIRDRFYSSASGTPASVFSTLMRLKNHHLAKLENPGQKVYFEKIISEIIDSIQDFPTHLSLEDQGRFAIGYYHQQKNFFTKNDSSSEGKN